MATYTIDCILEQENAQANGVLKQENVAYMLLVTKAPLTKKSPKDKTGPFLPVIMDLLQDRSCMWQ